MDPRPGSPSPHRRVTCPGQGRICNAVHVDDVCQVLLLAAVVPAAQGSSSVSATAPAAWLAFLTDTLNSAAQGRAASPGPCPVRTENTKRHSNRCPVQAGNGTARAKAGKTAHESVGERWPERADAANREVDARPIWATR